MNTDKIILKPNTPFLIGCVGRARHGKGTLANLLIKWVFSANVLRQRAHIISFADPLKDFLTSLIGREEPFRGDSTERNAPIPELGWWDLTSDIRFEAEKTWPTQDFKLNPTGRQLMQIFGTNVIRKRFCSDAWVRIAESRAKNFKGVTVIDDVRFPNEAQRCAEAFLPEKRFDLLFKIVRPGIPNIDHESEDAVDTIPLDAFDAIFINDGDVNKLEKQVLRWLKVHAHISQGY
jgi:hypothetical protein